MVLTVVIAPLGGYGFSRSRFPFKTALSVLVIASLMIPFQSILTPLFIILATVGLSRSLVGLTPAIVTLRLPFSVFIRRNAFAGLPREIEEAARIDGARDPRLPVRVLLPLVMPGVATVAIVAVLDAWSEVPAAPIPISDNHRHTLPVLMGAVRAGRPGAITWGAVQAGVITLPCLPIVLALRRRYRGGLVAGAVT